MAGGEMKGVTGVENKILYDEIKRATEERYPLSEGKIYVQVIVIFEFMRQHKDMFPYTNLASDTHMKRIISQTLSDEFKWKRYGNTRTLSARSAVFNRSVRVGDEE